MVDFDKREVTPIPGPRPLIEALVREFGLPLGFRGTVQGNMLEDGSIPPHSSGNERFPNCYTLEKEIADSESDWANLVLEEIMKRSINDHAKSEAQKDSDLFSRDPAKRYGALRRNLPVFYVFGEDGLKTGQTGITPTDLQIHGCQSAIARSIVSAYSGNCKVTDSGMFMVTEAEFDRLVPVIKAHSDLRSELLTGRFLKPNSEAREGLADIGYAFELFKEVIYAKMCDKYDLLVPGRI